VVLVGVRERAPRIRSKSSGEDGRSRWLMQWSTRRDLDRMWSLGKWSRRPARFGAGRREEEGGEKKAIFQRGVGAVEHAHAAVTLRRHGPCGARPAPPCVQLMRKPFDGRKNVWR